MIVEKDVFARKMNCRECILARQLQKTLHEGFLRVTHEYVEYAVDGNLPSVDNVYLLCKTTPSMKRIITMFDRGEDVAGMEYEVDLDQIRSQLDKYGKTLTVTWGYVHAAVRCDGHACLVAKMLQDAFSAPELRYTASCEGIQRGSDPFVFVRSCLPDTARQLHRSFDLGERGSLIGQQIMLTAEQCKAIRGHLCG